MPVTTRKRRRLREERGENLCGLVQGAWIQVISYLSLPDRSLARCVCRSFRALHESVPLPLFRVYRWKHCYPLPEAGVHMVMMRRGSMTPSVLLNFRSALRRTRCLTINNFSSYYTTDYLPTRCNVEELTVSSMYLSNPNCVAASWKRMKRLNRIHADTVIFIDKVILKGTLQKLKRLVPSLKRITYDKTLRPLETFTIDDMTVEHLDLDAIV